MQPHTSRVHLRSSHHSRTAAGRIRSRPCAVQAAASTQQTLQYRVRRAHLEDTQAVADLYSEVGSSTVPAQQQQQ
jgi:hypothetical protein